MSKNFAAKWNEAYGTEPKSEPKQVNRNQICMRCGLIGHSTIQCTKPLPSIDDLKNEMGTRILHSVKNAPKEWKEDDFGLYLPTDQRIIDLSKTWKDGKFCFNCGAFGHEVEDCPQPPFQTIYNLFSPYLTDNSSKSSLEKQRIIEAIHKFNQNNQIQENE